MGMTGRAVAGAGAALAVAVGGAMLLHTLTSPPKASVAAAGTWPKAGDHVYTVGPSKGDPQGLAFGPLVATTGGTCPHCEGIPNRAWDLEMAVANQHYGDYPPGYIGIPTSPAPLPKPRYLSGGDLYCQGSRFQDANGFSFAVPTVMPSNPCPTPPPASKYFHPSVTIAVTCQGTPSTLSRSQMAVYILQVNHGPSYQPPVATSCYADMTCPGAFTNWAKEAVAESLMQEYSTP